MRDYILRDLDRAAAGSMKWKNTRAGELPLWVADMDFPPPPAVSEALAQRISIPYYPYTLVPPELKDAFSAWCRNTQGWDPSRGALGVLGGVLFGMSSAVTAFTNPGDTVVVMSPVYPPFMNIPRALGRTVEINQLCDGGSGAAVRYRMDIPALEQVAARKECTMLFLCSPHNPVGRVWSRPELLELAAVCRRHNLMVVSDEIHADLVGEGHEFVSVGSLIGGMGTGLGPADGFDPERTLVIQAPSKTFNIPGLGLGMVWAPGESTLATLVSTVSRLGQSTINIMSLTAAQAAYAQGGPWLSEVRNIIRENGACLEAWVAQRPFLELAPRQGTYLAWLGVATLQERLGLDGMAFQNWLRSNAGVWLSPGPQFGPGGEGWIRLNLGCSPALLADALSRMDRAFSAINT